MIEIIPNLHPIFVHFTVTIVVFTGLLQLIHWLFKSRLNSTIALALKKWLLIVGAIAVPATILTGRYAASTVNHDTASHLAMLDHASWAIPTGIVYLLGVLIYYFLPKQRQVVAGIFFVAALFLVTVTAFKGGELVYRHGLGVMSLPEVTGEGHDHEHADENKTPAPSTATATPSEHEHSDDDHDTDSIEPPKQTSSLFSGLDSDAATTVIAFHQALNSGDAAKAASLLDDNVLIFEGGGVERSAEEYASHHMKSDIAFMAKMQVTLLEHQVQGNGDMAVSMSRSKIQGHYKDKDIDMESSETMVLRKHDGQWQIIHIHWSD